MTEGHLLIDSSCPEADLVQKDLGSKTVVSMRHFLDVSYTYSHMAEGIKSEFYRCRQNNFDIN